MLCESTWNTRSTQHTYKKEFTALNKTCFALFEPIPVLISFCFKKLQAHEVGWVGTLIVLVNQEKTITYPFWNTHIVTDLGTKVSR